MSRQNVQNLGSLTIDDVAQKCGLSPASVSLALSWRPGRRITLSTETRERILATAQEMGYRPSYRAKALAKGRSWQIAVAYTKPMGPVPSGAFQPVAENLDGMLRESKYHAVFIRMGASVDEWMDVLGDGRFDGIVLLCDPPAEVREWMVKRQVPVVVINGREEPRFCQVTVDDRDGARKLTEHLISLGHQRIAFYLGRETPKHHSAADRLAGYHDAMAAAGLVADEPFAGPVDDFVAKVRTGSYQPTAILDYEHFTAIRVLQKLWREGVRVPEQISVATFNDAYPVDAVTPSLTTMGMPSEEMARSAVEMLLGQIESKGEGQEEMERQKEFKLHLTVRESTSAPMSK